MFLTQGNGDRPSFTGAIGSACKEAMLCVCMLSLILVGYARGKHCADAQATAGVWFDKGHPPTRPTLGMTLITRS